MARIFLGIPIPIPNLSPRCCLYISVFLGAAILNIAWLTLPHYSVNRNPFLSDFQPPFNVFLPKHEDVDFISGPPYPAPTPTGSYNYKKAEWDEDLKHQDSDFISSPHYPAPAPTGSHNYKKAEWDEDSNYLADFSSTYKEMESKFKVYVYRDDVLNKYYKFPFPITDPDRLTWEYRNEGYFFRNINMSTFLTTDPKQAQLFFIPIRTHLMQSTEPSYEEMEIIVQNYVQSLIQEHPYWNRSQGADHFFVHCRETIYVPLLNNAIQVLCATQDVRQFNPSMDMFLPPLGYDIYPEDFNLSSGYDFIDRKRIVASKILKDLKIDVCSCSIALYYYYACIAKAIVENCIPVVSLSYPELPFNNTLDWTKFSVIDSEGDVLVNNIQEQLQEIVKDIEDETLIKLFSNLRKVNNVLTSSPVEKASYSGVLI
ncbi:probable glycosyltransferase At3g07620 [Quercus robur]|uniref:probable glycosyltransferase At3g07620 n=1 Tax=Quercus robur TaxID=38942 RepID=UPI0021632B58|nr:probable glycosyltransferase At3g07620 [Quercus robur]